MRISKADSDYLNELFLNRFGLPSCEMEVFNGRIELRGPYRIGSLVRDGLYVQWDGKMPVRHAVELQSLLVAINVLVKDFGSVRAI